MESAHVTVVEVRLGKAGVRHNAGMQRRIYVHNQLSIRMPILLADAGGIWGVTGLDTLQEQ